MSIEAWSVSFAGEHSRPQGREKKFPTECNKGTVYSFPFLMKEGMWVEEKREMSRLSPYYMHAPNNENLELGTWNLELNERFYRSVRK